MFMEILTVDYFTIAVFVILIFVVMLIAILIPKLISPSGPLAIVEAKHKRKTPYRYETYECGSIPIGDARIRFDIQYYIYPLIFLLFDVFGIFLYLWTVAFRSLIFSQILLVIVAIGILSEGLFFVFKKEEYL